MSTRQQVDRVYCNNCSTPQQISKAGDACLECGEEGAMFWLPDHNRPQTEWDESCTYMAFPKVLADVEISPDW